MSPDESPDDPADALSHDESLAQMAARDSRLLALQMGINCAHAFGPGGPFEPIIAAFRKDAADAMDEFVTCNPADLDKVRHLQARVYLARRALQVLEMVRHYAEQADRELQEETG